MKLAIIAVFLVFFVCSFLTDQAWSAVLNGRMKPPRPGVCPKPKGPGICVEACSGDDGCPMGQKCCSNGCGHVCMHPVPQKREPQRSCPKRTGPGLCAEMCSLGGCGPGQKCCFNGCGHQCMKTV